MMGRRGGYGLPHDAGLTVAAPAALSQISRSISSRDYYALDGVCASTKMVNKKWRWESAKTEDVTAER